MSELDKCLLYLASYTSVVDNQLYDSQWKMISQYMKQNKSPHDVELGVLNILGDSDDKISLNQLVSDILKLSESDLNKCFSFAIAVALSEGRLGQEEDIFLSKTASRCGYNHYKGLKKTILDEISFRGDDLVITKKKYGARLYEFLSIISPERLSDIFKNQYRKCLLSGPEYSTVIASMRDIAKEDISCVDKVLDDYSVTLEKAKKSLESSIADISADLQKISSSDDEIKESINKSVNGIYDDTLKAVNEIECILKKSLQKKSDSLDHFTISFLGRTKAGKSTLHSIILGGENKEFIGVGKERTTRFNRVYKWNGIRVIDTPGIGAPGGSSDTEIASDIIDESDLICFVVTTDSIQETEFAFLKGIKNQNKPVIILLNNKDDFTRTAGKRERFLQNPTGWYYKEGKDALQGHIDRIHEYVNKYYDNVNVKICPVHLLAAKIAQETENEKESSLLLKGSRMSDFLDDIRVNVLKYGCIRRSQTILDGTVFYFNNQISSLSKKENELKQLRDLLKKNAKDTLMKLKNRREITVKSIKDVIETQFSSFITSEIPTFVEEYYKLNEAELESRFQDLLKTSRLENKVKDKIISYLCDYEHDVKQIMESSSEKIQFSMSKLELSFDLPNTFDYKSLFSISGKLISLGGFLFTPLFFVGLAVQLFSWLFKSKQKKIEKRKSELTEQLSKQMEESKQSILKIIPDVKEKMEGMERKIKALFNSLADRLFEIIELLNDVSTSGQEKMEKLQRLYAIRILNMINPNHVLPLDTDMQICINREFGKVMNISLPEVVNCDTEKISKILQEDIIITKL